ncbi:unnamed protein product, partial [Urochloa humidicola]
GHHQLKQANEVFPGIANHSVFSDPALSIREEEELRPMECGTGTPIVELDDAHGNVYRCKHCLTRT